MFIRFCFGSWGWGRSLAVSRWSLVCADWSVSMDVYSFLFWRLGGVGAGVRKRPDSLLVTPDSNRAAGKNDSSEARCTRGVASNISYCEEGDEPSGGALSSLFSTGGASMEVATY